MQVIAPDFFGNYGGKAAAREEERAGDGLFDALLRREEARHARDAQPQREPRQTREVARAPLDDRPSDDRRIEDAADRAPAEADDTFEATPEEPVERKEAAEDGVAERAPSEAEPEQPHHDAENASGPASDDKQPTEATATAAADHSTTAPAQADGASPTQVAAQPGGMTAAAPVPPAKSTPAAPATDDSGAAPTTTAQPASAAAAAPRAADKASPVAAAKESNQTAAAHRQSATAAPSEPPARPGTRNGQAANPSGATTQAAPLESKPTAALGGGATTAAMAQSAEGGAKTAGAEGVAGAPEDAQAPATAKPAAAANQAAKAGEVLANVGKAAEQRLTAGDRPADGAAPNASQLPTTTALAAGGAGGTVPAHSSSFAEALAQARHGAPADPAQQIAIQVQRAQVAGQDQISIKLHPAELGRIEVKLENGSDGTLRAVISAERAETLELLQRDARGLERALQEAGVKTDSGSLSFNLRGQGQQQDQRQTADGGMGRSGDGSRPSSDEGHPAPAPAYRSSHNGALDIRV